MILPRDRKDYDSIYAFLKDKAIELSEGKWSDFSEGDIGNVMLHLMSYLGDMNNYQTDKTVSELYLDSAIERTDIMSLLKLIGYEPRHFESAYTYLQFEALPDKVIEDGTVMPANTEFTTVDNSVIYTIPADVIFYDGKATSIAYEGSYVSYNYTINNVTELGRIYLENYEVGINTVKVFVSTSTERDSLTRVDNVEFTTGEYAFSVHVDRDAKVYIQLPGFWRDIIETSTIITVDYLLSSGEDGRVGQNVLTNFLNSNIMSGQCSVTNREASVGGFHPETVKDLKISAPMWARTMGTIVTLDDFEQVAHEVPEIADTKALDYNYPDQTGFIQPDDAYKVQVYAVPLNTTENSLFDEEGNRTETCKKLIEYVDARRLASIMISYLDPVYIIPHFIIDIYLDKNDLRVGTIAKQVKEFIRTNYGRGKIEIGQSLYGSRMGSDVLDEFPFITYVEIHAPETNIPADFNEYIDVERATYTINVNDKNVINEPVVVPEPVDPGVCVIEQENLGVPTVGEPFRVEFVSVNTSIGSIPRITNIDSEKKNVQITKITITRADTDEILYTKKLHRSLSYGLAWQDTDEDLDCGDGLVIWSIEFKYI